mgnify:CR=1 FL=1|jgi:methylphosphotriester-DNA--protein-cysteine methyltransferase
MKKITIILVIFILIFLFYFGEITAWATNSSIANDNQLVYIDKEGIDVKYHEVDCNNIKPNRYYTITVKEAYDIGYRPCSECVPPIPSEIYEKRKEELDEIIQSINPTTNSTNNSNDSSKRETKTVYITKNSSVYHLAGCTHMNGTPHATTLEQAQSRGYGACEYCNPYVEKTDNKMIAVYSIIITIIVVTVILVLIENRRKTN